MFPSIKITDINLSKSNKLIHRLNIISLFVIFRQNNFFDILVHNGTYLLGTSFQDRVNLLDSLFGKNDCEKSYLYSVTENVYRVKSFTSNFKIIFEELSSIDMIEGLVCKRKSGKLEIGNTENNNTKSQIKFRKPTKNYKF